MTTVDPYTQPIPKTIVDSEGNMTREFRSWFVYDNRWKFDMWTRSGGGANSELNQEPNSSSLMFTLLAELRQDVGSGQALTIDDTGITIDSTKLSIDRTEY